MHWAARHCGIASEAARKLFCGLQTVALRGFQPFRPHPGCAPTHTHTPTPTDTNRRTTRTCIPQSHKHTKSAHDTRGSISPRVTSNRARHETPGEVLITHTQAGVSGLLLWPQLPPSWRTCMPMYIIFVGSAPSLGESTMFAKRKYM